MKQKQKEKNKSYHEKFDSFYQSKSWKLLRSQKFYASNGLCELCLKDGIINEAREIHHIVPIEKDWNKRLDYQNLIALCPEHHNLMHERISPLQQFLKDWDNL